jgi:5-formyltetrahydrofolate cyclo-ligase
VGNLIPSDNYPNSDPNNIAAIKARLRVEMRAIRRAVPDQGLLSAQIGAHVRTLDFWPQRPLKVMVYTAIAGEPDLTELMRWCTARGDQVWLPEQTPDPMAVDVVILPGVAFSRSGSRLGQGGGWYDRFLAQIRPDCAVVGVAFTEQLLDDLPVEDHDITMHHVVTQEGRVGPDPLG